MLLKRKDTQMLPKENAREGYTDAPANTPEREVQQDAYSFLREGFQMLIKDTQKKREKARDLKQDATEKGILYQAYPLQLPP